MKRLPQLVPGTNVRDRDRPARPVKCVRPALLIFTGFEIWEDTIPTPASATLRFPAIEILRLTTHVDHTVDRSGSAQHLSTRLEQAAIVQMWLGRAFITPVHARVGVKR